MKNRLDAFDRNYIDDWFSGETEKHPIERIPLSGRKVGKTPAWQKIEALREQRELERLLEMAYDE